jgi:DNA-binding LacI/PurR family transcriptional regulator
MLWIPSLDPPLAAVAQLTYGLGYTAADLVLQRSTDQDREAVEMKPEPTLMSKGSSGGQNERRGRDKGGNQGA